MNPSDVDNIIRGIPFARLESAFQIDSAGSLVGDVGIQEQSMSNTLVFHTVIYATYPYKIRGEEPIKFFNASLIDYPHIMVGGSLCLHTSYWTDPEERLKSDISQLRDWVVKYYIKEEQDAHYEHLVVEQSLYADCYYALHFTQFTEAVNEQEYGFAFVSYLRDGVQKEKTVKNWLLKSIGTTKENNLRTCLWNADHQGLKHFPCPYVVLDSIPCTHRKFALTNYEELNSFLTQEQKDFLHQYERSQWKRNKGIIVPILIGYKIPTGKTHWLAAINKIGDFPTSGTPEAKNGIKTGNWHSEFQERKIQWAMSYDASYNLFFGRGSFGKPFCEQKILLMGVGAVGSIVAKTLARCGCLNLTLCDFDIKKPENVCRSEYDFISGITDKATELANQLSATSPHLTVKPLSDSLDYLIKFAETKESYKKDLQDFLNGYDLIIDCTTDDDIMVIIEKYNLKVDVVNMSITNHASELVCAFSPNISRFVKTVFNTILRNDTSDMYEPTGCWAPTFKASYNDISILVQYAIRHIYMMISGKEDKYNFIIQDVDDGLKITRY